MKMHWFYQGGQLSAIGSIGQISVIFRSDFALLAEQRAGAYDKSVLLSTSGTNSIMHAARAIAYAPYGHADLLNHGAALAFNGQVRDSLTACDPLGSGKRLYSSKLMRFLSPDNYSPFGLGGVNTYVYCSSDPINFIDPSGNVKSTWILKRRYKTPVPRVTPNAIARDRHRLVESVPPMRNGEPVQRQVQLETVQRPGLREGAPTTADPQTSVVRGFTDEEQQRAVNIFNFAQAREPRFNGVTAQGRLAAITVIARHLRVESGGVLPIERDSLLAALPTGAPEERELRLSKVERWASVTIDSYRRANR